MTRLFAAIAFLGVAWSAEAAATLRAVYDSGTVTFYGTTTAIGVVNYDFERATSFPSWQLQARVGTLTWSQFNLQANTAYIYRLVIRDGALNIVEISNPVIVATHTHLDDPLDNTDPIRLQHMNDLRAAVAAIRTAAGAGAAVWTRPTLSTASSVADEDVLDLRSNFDAALVNLGLTDRPAYDAGVGPGLPVLRAHFQQMRDLIRTYPEMVYATASVANPYFSPNGDGLKDTTTFNATVYLLRPSRVDFRWRVDVRNPSGTVIRSATGTGTAATWAWDGKNTAGVVQPEATYSFDLVDLDSLSGLIAQSSARLDVTLPAATISSPADATLISNVYLNGSGTVSITGSALDETAIESWDLERSGNSQATVSLATSTSSVSNATLATWETTASSGWLANGGYTLTLTVTDKAGNRKTDEVPVTVGHFSANRSRAQADVAAGETVSYTSNVPFTLAERIEIRKGGSVVRTLVNAQRASGTYTDVWDGRDDQGQIVGDGPYFYYAVLTAGASSFTWDRSNVHSGGGKTQYEYPKCWTGTEWRACSDTAVTFPFDPYAGKPLRIAWCVGTGQPDSGCSGTTPALVVAKVTTGDETSANCDSGCFISEYQSGGRHEMAWFGSALSGTWVGDRSKMTIIRQFDQVPESMTLVHGTSPVITNVSVTPPMFGPAAVPSPASAQVFTLTLTRYASRPVTVTAVFRNLEYGSILRTVTSAAQNSDVVTLSWDGRADNGERAAPGRYEVLLTVTDSVGSTATIKPLMVVRY